jgi:hypothetical protein
MQRASVVLLVLALTLGVAGCYDNVPMTFEDTGLVTYPDGGMGPSFAPWETPNQASLPAAVGSDECPETLTQVEVHDYMGGHVADVHAAACIHASPADVWIAIQDPETAHDPTSTNSFSVINPPMASECIGDYQTQINAGTAPFTVDFRLCWRHGLITGTDAAPLLTQSRWQKVWGTTAIRTLEGSLVMQPHPADPEHVTEVYYQYHLDSVTVSGTPYDTIHAYLTQIYSRLVTRSHGTML